MDSQVHGLHFELLDFTNGQKISDLWTQGVLLV